MTLHSLPGQILCFQAFLDVCHEFKQKKPTEFNDHVSLPICLWGRSEWNRQIAKSKKNLQRKLCASPKCTRHIAARQPVLTSRSACSGKMDRRLCQQVLLLTRQQTVHKELRGALTAHHRWALTDYLILNCGNFSSQKHSGNCLLFLPLHVKRTLFLCSPWNDINYQGKACSHLWPTDCPFTVPWFQMG